MGGAASAHAELEQMVACTFLLGQALTRAFPEIYTLNDFHADKEKLQAQMQKEHERKMANLDKRVPMVFLAPDGTVTPIKFVANDANKQDSGEATEDQGDQGDQEDHTAEEEPIPEGCIAVPYQGRQVPLRLDELAQSNEDGWTVLHACSHQQGASEAAQILLTEFQNRGLDLDAKTKRGPGSYAHGWTALQIACAYGVVDTAQALITAGADVETRNSIDWAPLHEAVHRGFKDITERLLRAGADPNILIPSSMIAPYHPQYPLAHACRQGHVSVARALIDGGADKDAQNEGGWTALHECVFFRNEACVKLLLEYECNLSLETKQGYNVLDFESAPSILKLLKEAAPESLLEANQAKAKAKALGEQPVVISANPDEQEQKESKEGDSEKREYRLLGDLPDFKANSFMQSIASAPVANAEEEDDEKALEARRERIKERQKARKAQGKRELKGVAPPEEGVPPEYACHLTGKLLADPVTTIYGNHFEKTGVIAWIRSQGNLCPVTGQPLSESDCIVDKDLRIEISDWQLRQALGRTEDTELAAETTPQDATADLYDF